MESSIFKQAADYLRNKKNAKRWLVVFLCLAVAGGIGTYTVLRLTGQAMTKKSRELVCSYQTHTHTDACYSEVNGEKKLVCGYADYVVHTHNDDCYDENGNLVCPLPEIKEHKHDESCYDTVRTLTCGQEERPAHTHTADCYSVNSVLTCGQTETPGHTHDASCYDAEGNLICGQAETPGHTHDASCYTEERTLVCGQEETAGHTHSDACYSEEKQLVCGELELHTHTDECYEVQEGVDADNDGEDDKILICDIPVLEEHMHTADCFVTVDASEKEADGSGDADDTKDEGERKIYTQEDDAADGTADEPVYYCGKEEHTHTAECVAPDGADDTYICGKEEHTHDASCLIENAAALQERIYEDDAVRVIVRYDETANIPEDAELAVTIPDEEQKAARMEEAAEWINSESDTWLLDIGMEQGGEPVQPEDAVYVTVEAACEDFAAGMPVSVVQFAENGPELAETLTDGQTAAGGFSTTFKLESFSELMVILDRAEQSALTLKEYQLNGDFSYETDEFQMTLHVNGVATAEVPAVGSEAEDEASLEPEINGGAPAEVQESKEPEGDAPENDAAESGEPEADESTEPGEDQAEGTLPALTAENVDFSAEQLGEDDEIYAAFEAAVANQESGEDQTEGTEQEEQQVQTNGAAMQLMSVLKLGFRLNGSELDVSNCEITAEVTPKQAAFTEAEPAESEEGEETETEAESSLTLMAMQYNADNANGEVETLTSATVSKSEIKPMNFSLMSGQNNNYMAIAGEDPMNIEFHVQYYAWLEEPVLSDTEPNKMGGADGINVIETDAGGNNTGGILPNNSLGMNQNLKRIKVTKLPDSENVYPSNYASMKAGMQGTYVIQTNQVLKPIFEFDESFVYRDRPGFDYIKMLPGKYGKHYDLAEIWVLKDGKDPESTNAGDWDSYPIENFSMTNQDEGNPNTLVVKDGMVIRLIYNRNTGTQDIDAMFHDYDISNGKIAEDKGTQKIYYTAKNGINDPSNCSAATKLAFGNMEGSDYGIQPGNMASNGSTGIPKVFGNCYFGLAKKNITVGSSDIISIASPQIFGIGGTTTGKTTYSEGYTLNFDRDGDTYTLVSVNNGATGAKNLDRFWALYSYSFDLVYANDFWPMDTAHHNGEDPYTTNTNKEQFSFNTTTKSTASNHRSLYGSSHGTDNGLAHNCYFGMQYALTFDFDEHYVGPLEYFFFGDDDMWVYLDGELICDIGGVHSAIGEHVNLWDYLDRETDANKPHTLSVFFTERGGTGSTCYTQFTLPSIEFLPPTASLGSLEISKEVDGTADKDIEYDFELELDSADTYKYSIKDASDNKVKDGTIANGESFKLKAGQKLVISDIPLGTEFTVKELHKFGFTPTVKVDGNERTLTEDGAITGVVSAPTAIEVAYTNHASYALPESGGPGTLTYIMSGMLLLTVAASLMYIEHLHAERRKQSIKSSRKR